MSQLFTPQSWSLVVSLVVFVSFTAMIAFSGAYLTRISDRLADITGIGEALFGALLLGAVTSLSGFATSITAAYGGYPELAVSNGVGGIAAQTALLALADIVYRRANLEHAAASLANMMQATLLIVMLAFILVVILGPKMEWLSFHPASLLMFFIYLAGMRLVHKSKQLPMWHPQKTKETVEDFPHFSGITQKKTFSLWGQFILTTIVFGFAGFMIGEAAIGIIHQSPLSQSFVGAMFTGISNAMPELIISIAAVRQRALTLAVGNIIGGNTFDILSVAFSDFAYRESSIYHVLTVQQFYLIALTLLLTSTLMLGLLYRDKFGFARIGWESVCLLLIFIGGYAVLFFF